MSTVVQCVVPHKVRENTLKEGVVGMGSGFGMMDSTDDTDTSGNGWE